MFKKMDIATLVLDHTIKVEKMKDALREKLEDIVSRSVTRIEYIKEAKNTLDSEQRQAETERDDAAKAIIQMDI